MIHSIKYRQVKYDFTDELEKIKTQIGTFEEKLENSDLITAELQQER